MEFSKEHPVRKLFRVDTANNTSQCIISPEFRKHMKPLKGIHAGNMWRHVQRNHSSAVKAIEEELREKNSKRKRHDRDCNLSFIACENCNDKYAIGTTNPR